MRHQNGNAHGGVCHAKSQAALNKIASHVGSKRHSRDKNERLCHMQVMRHKKRNIRSASGIRARIAETLFVSENTVRTHSKRIYAKLDVHKKQQLRDLVESYE